MIEILELKNYLYLTTSPTPSVYDQDTPTKPDVEDSAAVAELPKPRV